MNLALIKALESAEKLLEKDKWVKITVSDEHVLMEFGHVHTNGQEEIRYGYTNFFEDGTSHTTYMRS